MSAYLVVRSDPRYATAVEPDAIVQILRSRPHVRRVSPAEFNSVRLDAWWSCVVVASDSDGSFSSDGNLPAQVNLVSFVCNDDTASMRAAVDAALAIAAALDWEVVDDESQEMLFPEAEGSWRERLSPLSGSE